jgi:uracil-DNA glycosylase family 4
MSDLTAANLARQARQHLESLKASGVEWLPLGAPPVRLAPAAKPQAAAASLFESAPAVPVESPVNPDQRRHELKLLAERVSTCTRCPELVSTRRQTVFGVGPIDPPLLLIGEAPGADEDRLGEPFVGAAGQLLNRILIASGFQREEVYICNVIKCRPPGNRTPKPEEVSNCREYLDRQIDLVRPQFICCLGGTAAQHLLGVSSLGKLRGRFHDYKGIPVMCTYHPAFLLPHRQPAKKKEVWEDMQMLLKRMGRPIPKPSK